MTISKTSQHLLSTDFHHKDMFESLISNSPLISPRERWIVFFVTTLHRLSSFLQNKNRSNSFYSFVLLLLCFILFTIIICKWIFILWLHHDHHRTSNKSSTSVLISSSFILIFAILIHHYSISSSTTTMKHDISLYHQRNNFYEAWITLQNFTIRTYPHQPLRYLHGQWYRTWNQSMSLVRFRGINLPAKTPNFPFELRSTRPNRDHPHSYEEYMKLLYSSKATVSFMDRPIPLSTADEHFARLSLYGFNLIRLSVPWEAVMPSAAGKLDTGYLSYLSQLIDIAAKYGLYVIIDPHQDVWSRFTGGDGAPWWTLSVAGFDMDHWYSLVDTDAALLHASSSSQDESKIQWPTNYGKLAAATMFTLFFAGDVFAPGIMVEDDGCFEHESFWRNVDFTCHTDDDPTCYSYQDLSTDVADCGVSISIQSYLRKYYLMFLAAVAHCVQSKMNVIGFNSMNEPSNGFVGLHDIRTRQFGMPVGNLLSAFDGMVLASGEQLEGVEYYSSPNVKSHSKRILNRLKRRAWKNENQDIWLRLGIFEKDFTTRKPTLMQPHFFGYNRSFMDEFMGPFYRDVQRIVQRFSDRFVIFAEPYINCTYPSYNGPPESFDSNKLAWSPHWYDPTTLLLKRYSRHIALDLERMRPVFLSRFISRSFQKFFKNMRELTPAQTYLLIGETGVPFDIEGCGINDSRICEEALDRTLRGIEANNIDYVLWNYCHDNNSTQGDNWNGENLSLRVGDPRDRRNRGILSAVRPYAYQHSPLVEIAEQIFHQQTISGPNVSKLTNEYRLKLRCTRSHMDNQRRSYDQAFVHIYLPALQFVPDCDTSYALKVSDGDTVYNHSLQTLFWSGLSCLQAMNFDEVISFELSIAI